MNHTDTAFLQMMNISDILNDEIKNRSGRGRERFDHNANVISQHFKSIKDEIESFIFEILSHNNDSEKNHILSRWIMTILFDSQKWEIALPINKR